MSTLQAGAIGAVAGFLAVQAARGVYDILWWRVKEWQAIAVATATYIVIMTMVIVAMRLLAK